MNARSFLVSGAILAAGFAVDLALFWALLNVPESNVAALGLSATLIVLGSAIAGVAIGAAVTVASGVSIGRALVRGLRALPMFVVGLLLFGLLWWASGAAASWWSAHAGEVDAVFLRYANLTRTRWLHLTVAWVLFLARWALGLSIVLGLVAASAIGGDGVIRRGLRTAVRAASLAAATAGVVVISEGLWRAVYWRPASLTTSLEPAFAIVKLALLYAGASAVAAAVLAVYRRNTGSGVI